MLAQLLVSPSLETRKQKIVGILADNNLSDLHPDLLYFPADSKLGIEQVRKIKQQFSLKPYQAKGRAVVLEDASALTVEAQNALLKTLEELPVSALFILGIDSDSKLQPTVLSRCQIIALPDVSTQHTPGVGYEKDIEKLLESRIDERFEYVEKLKDKGEFLKALTSYFHQHLPSHLPTGRQGVESSPRFARSDAEGAPASMKVAGEAGTDYTDFLKELLQAEQWAAQNVNIRAILEYLMLRLPSAE